MADEVPSAAATAEVDMMPPSPASSTQDSTIDVESMDDEDCNDEQQHLVIDEEYGEPPLLTPEVILPVDTVLAEGNFHFWTCIIFGIVVFHTSSYSLGFMAVLFQV